MSFHDVRLDTRISYGASGGPGYATTIQTTASGHEYRITRQAGGRRVFEFSKELLEADDWSDLISFASARRGHLHGFRFKDWSDYTTAPNGRDAPTATDQVLGSGDAATTQFQLLKTYDSSGPNPEIRNLTLPVAGTLLVAIDGTPTTSYTATNPGGIITFASAPADGSVVTAGCEFDTPVRFQLPNEAVRVELIEGLLAQWSRIGAVELLNEVETPELWYPGGSNGGEAISSDVTLTFAANLWVFTATGTLNAFLPAPDRVPGGARVLTVHVTAGSSGTLQVRDDAGSAVGSAIAAGATKHLHLSRGASAVWVIS